MASPERAGQLRGLVLTILLWSSCYLSPGLMTFCPKPQQAIQKPFRASPAQSMCLASAIWHEARGEPLEGQRAVQDVVLNRARARKLSVCKVVMQPRQFSFVKDSLPLVKNPAKIVASVQEVESIGPCALYFHTVNVNPPWAKHKVHIKTIGRHKFYREDGCDESTSNNLQRF